MSGSLKSLFNVRLAITFFVLVLLAAHILAPATYDWSQQSISQLGAQQYEWAWIMNVGFMVYGFWIGMAVLLRFLDQPQKNYADLLIIFYGVAYVLVGIFQMGPLEEGVSYSVPEHYWHEAFMRMAGMSFTLGVFWHALLYAPAKQRWIHLLFLVLIVGLGISMELANDDPASFGFGLIMRLWYLLSFGWLLYRYQ